MYISSGSLPLNKLYRTLISLRVGMIELHFCVCGGCLICLIFLVVKLLTGFESFGPPVKDFTLGVSVVILD